MKYQCTTYGSENILLEDEQYFKLLSAWDAGADEFRIGDRRVPRKAIAYLGFTKESAEQFRIEESEYERSLPPSEAKKLREMKYQYALKAVSKKNNAIIESGRTSYERRWKSLGSPDIAVNIEKEPVRSLPMSAEESEAGMSEFYLDEFGQKMYS